MPTAQPTLAQIRKAVAHYMASEGCSCCGNYEQHQVDAKALGRLLRVKPYADGSGYDFRRYRDADRTSS